MDEEKGVNVTCGECGKSAAEGWALYCVQCCEDSMVKAAVAEEREACARLCEADGLLWGDYATAIRARGEA